MLNTITIQGRFTADPTAKMTQNNTPVISFTLACERDYQKQTDFFNCTAWRQTADFIGKNFRKGQMAVVSGRLQNREWTDKDNKKHTVAEILVDKVYFCQKAEVTETKFSELPANEEELPF